MYKNKLLLMLLVFTILIASIACSNMENYTNDKEPHGETEISVSSQNKQVNGEDLSIPSENHESLEANFLYSSEAEYEDLHPVDEGVYSAIAEICSAIDFYGKFNNERDENYEVILEKYYEVVIGQKEYMTLEADNGNSYEVYDSLGSEEYTYYVFDMDDDGVSELIVSDGVRFTYIFTYDKSNDRILLIKTVRSNSRFLGDNKISYWNAGIGLTYGFYEIIKEKENLKLSFILQRIMIIISNKKMKYIWLVFLKERLQLKR